MQMLGSDMHFDINVTADGVSLLLHALRLRTQPCHLPRPECSCASASGPATERVWRAHVCSGRPGLSLSEVAWNAPAGKAEIARFLLEHKADPNMTGAQVRGLMSTQGHPMWQAGARFKICTQLRSGSV